MLFKNRCNICGCKQLQSQLWVLKNIAGTKACASCYKNLDTDRKFPYLQTVEEYLAKKENKPIVRTVDQSSTVRSTEGIATIDNQQYTTILEEETLVTRRVILKPPS